MHDKTRAFIDALEQLERDSDAETIAKLFADDADVSNPMVEHVGEGEAGALAFWRNYRKAFGTIRSEFRDIVEDGNVAMLEWTSTGTSDGQDFRYGGVSAIEHGDGGIASFRTYFNPLKF